jgi:hypothetical protein
VNCFQLQRTSQPHLDGLNSSRLGLNILIVRIPQFFGLNGRQLGLHFDFKYRTIDAGAKFENRFFAAQRALPNVNAPRPYDPIRIPYTPAAQK